MSTALARRHENRPPLPPQHLHLDQQVLYDKLTCGATSKPDFIGMLASYDPETEQWYIDVRCDGTDPDPDTETTPPRSACRYVVQTYDPPPAGIDLRWLGRPSAQQLVLPQLFAYAQHALRTRVFGIIVDKDGNTWVGTPEQTYAALAQQRIPDVEWDISPRMPPILINTGAVCQRLRDCLDSFSRAWGVLLCVLSWWAVFSLGFYWYAYGVQPLTLGFGLLPWFHHISIAAALTLNAVEFVSWSLGRVPGMRRLFWGAITLDTLGLTVVGALLTAGQYPDAPRLVWAVSGLVMGLAAWLPMGILIALVAAVQLSPLLRWVFMRGLPEVSHGVFSNPIQPPPPPTKPDWYLHPASAHRVAFNPEQGKHP